METYGDGNRDERPAGGQLGGRRRVWIGAGVVVLGLVVFVGVWFQPHTLLIDERVDQAVPTADPGTTSDAAAGAEGPSGTGDDDGQDQPTSTSAPPEPVELSTGSFVSLDHTTSGTVRVIELADGRRFVRFEDLETDNGPDLFVYLSTNPAHGPEGAFTDGFADLGVLQGNLGDQNYEIPGDVDPSAYASVVIWCDRFTSAFGAADLVPVATSPGPGEGA